MDEVQQVEPLATCRVSTVSLHVPFTLVPTRSEAMHLTRTYAEPSSRPHVALAKLEDGGGAPLPQLRVVNQHAIGWPAWLLCMWELRDCWTIVRIQCIVFLIAFLNQVWAATFQLPRAALQQCLASIPCTSFLPLPKKGAYV